MIEIISGIDPQKGGYNRKIWSSRKGTENFMREILSSNVQPETVGSIVYSIHFYDKYFVFSKNKIVRDPYGAKRIGTLSYSIAIETKKEWTRGRGFKLKNFELTPEFITEYVEKKQYPDKPKKGETVYHKNNEELKGFFGYGKVPQKQEKETVYLYYESDTELDDYFCYDVNYRKFERIFFIDETYKGQDNNPLKSIQHAKETTFEELTKAYIPKRDKTGIKVSITETLKNRGVIFFLGVLLGIASIYKLQEKINGSTVGERRNNNYENLTNENNILKLDTTRLNNTIAMLNDSIRKLNNRAQIKYTDKEKKAFIINEVMDMTIRQIYKKSEESSDIEKGKGNTQ
jgi:hypothetical protein